MTDNLYHFALRNIRAFEVHHVDNLKVNETFFRIRKGQFCRSVVFTCCFNIYIKNNRFFQYRDMH